ncbi:MAG TPA: aldo/keto reductase [Bacillota bacterium]|nr:aldo/keto reductase [Bacillota bacterium]
MQYRELGKTGIKVSAVALGCMAFVGDSTWGSQDEKDSCESIIAALDGGITLFDTAESYGNGYSEELLGKALQGRRSEAVIATKVYKTHMREGEVQKACEDSLKRLKTDYIDLYQIHWPNWDVPIEETMGALEKLRQDGKIRAIGVCNFGIKDLEGVLQAGTIVTNQLPYNLLWRVIEHELIPKCQENNIGVICYSSLSQGLLTGVFKSADDFPAGRARTRLFSGSRPDAKHGESGFEKEVFEALGKIDSICQETRMSMTDIAIAWLLSQEIVTSLLASARNAKEAIENAKSADIKLSNEIIGKLNRITEDLKMKIGTNPDPWASGAQTRFR